MRLRRGDHVPSNEASEVLGKPASQEDARLMTPHIDRLSNSTTLSIPRKPLPNQHTVAVETDETLKSGWRPTYLKRRVLIVFAITFACLIASIEVLYEVSQSHHGLASPVENRYYLWKYGPTAVVVLVSAFWARTTYQAKLAAPWIELQRGSTAPELTVLLDYVSLLELTALFKSLKKRDFVVFAAVFGGFLLKLLLIFSTALLTLDKIALQQSNVSLTVQNAFVDDNSRLKQRAYLPYFVIGGILNNSLPYPDGTNPEFAFQTFNASDLPYDSQLSATVEGFAGDLECEDANLTVGNWSVETFYDPSPISRGLIEVLDYSSPTCYIKNISMIDDTLSTGIDLELDSVYWMRMKSVQCDGQAGDDANRILVSAGQVKAGLETKSVPPDLNLTANLYEAVYYIGTASFLVQRSVNLICKLTYDILSLSISINGTDPTVRSGITIERSPNIPNRTLNSVHAWDIAQAQFRLFDSGDSLPEILPDFSTDFNYFTDLQLQLGIYLAGQPLPSLDELLTPLKFRNVTTAFYQAYSAQIAHSSLMTSVNSSVVGTATANEDRLVVQSVSARSMEAIFAILMVLTTIILVRTPRLPLAPTDLSTLAGIFTVLGGSRELVSTLQDKSSSGEKVLRASVSDRSYTLSTPIFSRGTEFGIAIVEHDQAQKRSPASSVAKFRWWQPIPSILWIQIAMFVAVAAVIVALEVLLQKSQKHNGLGDVTSDKYYQYIWTYIPALTMVLISLYFSALDVSVRTMTTYHKLRQGCYWAASMPLNLVDKTATSAIFKAFLSRHYAATLTTSAAILGSFLTILVSGLYTATDISSVHDLVLTRDTWFAWAAPTVYQDMGTWTAGLILDANLSYPSWTFEDLAFSSFSILQDRANETASLQNSTMQIEVRIPAMRAQFDCRMYTMDQMTVNFTWGPQGGLDPMNNSLIVYIPEETCDGGIPTNNDGYGYYDNITPFWSSTQPNSYLGAGPKAYSGGCSHYELWWGYINSTGVESLTAMACNETMEELLADATFISSPLRIDKSHPPRPDESTVQPANVVVEKIDFLETNNMANISEADTLNSFFSSIVYGRYGIPIANLGSSAKNQIVYDAIVKQMRIIKAQQTNVLLRAPTSQTNATTFTLNATGTSRDRRVLVQNAPSTRAVEGVLAAMLVLAALSKLLINTSRVLPFSPTSIAAMGSLLADSNLLDPAVFPEGPRGIEKRESALMKKNTKETSQNVKGIYRLGWFDPNGYSVGWKAKGGGPGRIVFTINAVSKESESKDDNLAGRNSVTSSNAEAGSLLLEHGRNTNASYTTDRNEHYQYGQAY